MHKIMHAVVALSIIKGIVVGTIAYERFGMTGLILSAIVLPLLAMGVFHIALKWHTKILRRSLDSFSYLYILQLPERVAAAIIKLIKDHLTQEEVDGFQRFLEAYTKANERNPNDLLRRIRTMCTLMEEKLRRMQQNGTAAISFEETKNSLARNSKLANDLYQLLNTLMQLQKNFGSIKEHGELFYAKKDAIASHHLLESKLREALS